MKFGSLSLRFHLFFFSFFLFFEFRRLVFKFHFSSPLKRTWIESRCWSFRVHLPLTLSSLLPLSIFIFSLSPTIDPSPILFTDWHTSDLAFYKWIKLVSQFNCHFCQHLFSCPISPSSQTAHNYLKPRITHFIFSFLT